MKWLLEVVVGVILLLVGFLAGLSYQQTHIGKQTVSKEGGMLEAPPVPIGQPIADGPPNTCPWDTFMCPNGAVVIRTPPTCEFESCPATLTVSITPKPPRTITTKLKTATWPVYRDTYDGMLLTFRYPPGYEIFDEDSSLNLSIGEINKPWEQQKRAGLWRIMADVPYKGEPLIDWFSSNVLFRDLSSIQSTISLEPLMVNGKQFVEVQKQEDAVIDYYYGVQKSVPFYVTNKGMSEEQFLAILDSFVLISPPPTIYYQPSQ